MLVVDVIVGIPVSVLSKRSKDAVVAVRVPVTCQLPVMWPDPENGDINSTISPPPAPAFKANEAVTAWDEVVAWDEVPVKFPVNEPVNDPVEEVPVTVEPILVKPSPSPTNEPEKEAVRWESLGLEDWEICFTRSTLVWGLKPILLIVAKPDRDWERFN